jgi:hypothetical protein
MSTSESVINVAIIEARIKALEAAAIAKEHSIATWLKSNWLHIANGAGILATILKVFGKL